MAKRYLEKIAINGTEYNLLGFTSYDFLPSTATGTYIYSQSGNNFPYGISAGYDFSNDSSLFPTLSSEGISRNLDNYADTYIKKYLYDSTTPAFGVFYNSNVLILAGWVNNSQENTTQCSIGIILDDENEIGWILERVYFSPTRNITSIACKGGNTTDGQLIYSIFGNPVVKITSNGGGATHIAKVTGQLKNLSSNLSDILMVSGGGGGGLLVGDTDYSGKEAGGISGSGDNSADQSTGNAFGQGESGTNVSGGGSGLYGGYKGTSAKSGGAGSGYIGNSLLSNKKMVGYNVPTSSSEGTKTESVNDVSASAVSGKPKSGNGFVRITLKSLS